MKKTHPSRTGEAIFFRFEADIESRLECFPMCVRWMLDQCGIKLSLRQWRLMPRDERRRLLEMASETSGETAPFRGYLLALLERHAGEPPRPIAADSALWLEREAVPAAVTDKARLVGALPPTVDQWRSLTGLQRFALLKLASGLGNRNFVPALREFGLI